MFSGNLKERKLPVKHDPLREDLVTELRALRRGAGTFGQDRLADSEILIDFVGCGSVEQVYTKLLEVLDREGKDYEAPILAFFEATGHGIEGENLDERLNSSTP